jgi:hypothetical protein
LRSTGALAMHVPLARTAPAQRPVRAIAPLQSAGPSVAGLGSTGTRIGAFLRIGLLMLLAGAALMTGRRSATG